MLRRLLPFVLLAGPAVHARAAGLEVVPILVEIEPKAPRAHVVVRNLADAPVRLEISVSAWDQGPDGRMLLAPAPNLVVYPPLLELPAKGERQVRISAAGGFGAMEGSYRLFVNELPDPAKASGTTTAVRFLTRLGIPVFLLPPKKLARLEFAEAGVKDGRLAFQLRNTGNTRLYPTKVSVSGLDADGKPLFASELDTWYVLAGGHRTFDFAIPKADCAKVRKLTLELPAQQIPVRTGVETPGGACGP